MEIYKTFTLEQKEYGAYYGRYIDNVKGLTLPEALTADVHFFEDLGSLDGTIDLGSTYQEGKWTIAEVLQHCVDTERVFAGRAARLLRKDRTPLPGFDQDEYAKNSFAGSQTLHSLIRQWDVAREFTKVLFENAEHEAMEFIGEASGHPISARAIALIIPGHNLHHAEVLRTRYGLDV